MYDAWPELRSMFQKTPTLHPRASVVYLLLPHNSALFFSVGIL